MLLRISFILFQCSSETMFFFRVWCSSKSLFFLMLLWISFIFSDAPLKLFSFLEFDSHLNLIYFVLMLLWNHFSFFRVRCSSGSLFFRIQCSYGYDSFCFDAPLEASSIESNALMDLIHFISMLLLNPFLF